MSGGTHERLGVVWYLAPPEDNGDGRHRGYLNQPKRFRHCDQDLYDAMERLERAGRRDVAAVEESGVLGKETLYFGRLLCASPDPGVGPAATALRRRYRAEWVKMALAAMAGADLVFLDPDNGIGGTSFRAHGSKGHKHASWDEIRQFAADGARTLVCYHHTGRNGTAKEQAAALVGEIAGSMALGFQRGTSRIFLVAPARGRASLVRERVDEFLRKWGEGAGDHFTMLA